MFGIQQSKRDDLKEEKINMSRLMDTEMDIFLFDIAENLKEKHTRTIQKAHLDFKEYLL